MRVGNNASPLSRSIGGHNPGHLQQVTDFTDLNNPQANKEFGFEKTNRVKGNFSLERLAVLNAIGQRDGIVKKIVCFGLGSMRHPAYNDDDEMFLTLRANESNIDIRFVVSPDGLLEIDENTFVFAPGRPTFASKQLVADLTHEHGGPVAIFFEEGFQWSSAGPG
ncbi:hypothetical protein DPSP01_006925 [Paraphaeosphaeria sporulosa]